MSNVLNMCILREVFPCPTRSAQEGRLSGSARSAELTVPPPHFNVNIGMVTVEPPSVKTVTPVLDKEGHSYVDVSFDKFMLTDTITSHTITVTDDGQPAAGILAPVSTLTGPEGTKDGVIDIYDLVLLARDFGKSMTQ